MYSIIYCIGSLLMIIVGKNTSCPSRSSQDLIPSLESTVHEIHRELVRRSNRHERYLQRRRTTRIIPRTLRNHSSNFPLCSHQIPSLRTNSIRNNTLTRPRNPTTKTTIRLPRRRNKCILHLSPRSNPCQVGIRNKARLSILPSHNM